MSCVFVCLCLCLCVLYLGFSIVADGGNQLCVLFGSLFVNCVFVFCVFLCLCLCFRFSIVSDGGNQLCVLFGSLLPAACFAFHSPELRPLFVLFCLNVRDIATHTPMELFLILSQFLYF